MKWVILWTDAFVYLLILGALFLFLYERKSLALKSVYNTFLSHSRYIVALLILSVFFVLGFLDTIHFQTPNQIGTYSLLDKLLSPYDTKSETTYSAPFALYSFSPEFFKLEDESIIQMKPRLKMAGQNLANPLQDRPTDIFKRTAGGLLLGLFFSGFLYLTFRYFKVALNPKVTKAFWITLTLLICIVFICAFLMFQYHIMGTDKVGRDIFYIVLKSIRTGLVIGTLTTFLMLPFAILLGTSAGYFGGWVDDMIQYVYTTLSSIPGILLIAASIISFQTKIEQDPDLRLFVLCIILGVTSWTGLCRLLRGETLKLREMDFVSAAITLGVSRFRIILRHIIPNLTHIVIITLVLDFSGLVLAEAVLSYVGVGVDPSTFSFGNLINASRLELAREPVVWWSLAGALSFMFVLVFAANIVSDGVQEALNPRARYYVPAT